MKLERLYRLWQQIFIRYYASEADVVALFDGPPEIQHGTPHRRYQVSYFRDRDDYIRALQAVMPNIGYPGRCISRFEQPRLLLCRQGQRRPHHVPRGHAPVVPRVAAGGPHVGGKANFWIVEGIAMYMESLGRRTATMYSAASTTSGCTPPGTGC